MGLFHITQRAAWAEAQARGEYRPPSLEKEGFIHLSSDRQWQVAGNRFYRRQSELVLLSVDSRPERLSAELRFEEADGDRYPHLYGPLALGAVVGVHPLALDERGLFDVPPGLASSRESFLPAAHRLPLEPAAEARIKGTERGVASVLLCVVPKGQQLSAVLCLEARSGHGNQLSLKAIGEALKFAGVDPLLSRCHLMQLPQFPRRADGHLDEPALLGLIERLLGDA